MIAYLISCIPNGFFLLYGSASKIFCEKLLQLASQIIQLLVQLRSHPEDEQHRLMILFAKD
jgi:hypothetical protein